MSDDLNVYVAPELIEPNNLFGLTLFKHQDGLPMT